MASVYSVNIMNPYGIKGEKMIRLESSMSDGKVVMEFYHEEGANIQELCEKFGAFLLAIGYVFDPVTHEIALVEREV